MATVMEEGVKYGEVIESVYRSSSLKVPMTWGSGELIADTRWFWLLLYSFLLFSSLLIWPDCSLFALGPPSLIEYSVLLNVCSNGATSKD